MPISDYRTALVTGASSGIGAAVVELWIGVKAEGQSLESIAAPLSSRA